MDVVGYTKGTVNQSLLVIIKEQSGERGLAALMDENATRELSANWNAPFENETLQSFLERSGQTVANLAGTAITAYEMETGKTTRSTFNSTRIWEGSNPHSFSLTLNFVAFEDPIKEVHEALKRLEEWTSPELAATMPVSYDSTKTMSEGAVDVSGRMPPQLMLSIGRLAIFSDMVITSVSIPIGGPKTKDGYLLSAAVNVTIERTRTTNATEIAATFGG